MVQNKHFRNYLCTHLQLIVLLPFIKLFKSVIFPLPTKSSPINLRDAWLWFSFYKTLLTTLDWTKRCESGTCWTTSVLLTWFSRTREVRNIFNWTLDSNCLLGCLWRERLFAQSILDFSAKEKIVVALVMSVWGNSTRMDRAPLL